MTHDSAVQPPSSVQSASQMSSSTPPPVAIEPSYSATKYKEVSATCHTAPALCDDAYHGVMGRILKKLEPQTEAHPAAVLIELLISFGSVIGRTAYWEVEHTRHYGNVNAVRVGKTSKGRKGTASARAAEVTEKLDSTWFAIRRTSGLSSGEGLINEVRDDLINEDGDVVKAGVADKRLMVYEGEFAKPLIVMERQGNSLSTVIRDATDGKNLRSMVTGSPLMATAPHISILGDITEEELKVRLSHADTFNGFANRFLWMLTERMRVLSRGGADLDWTHEIEELKQAVEFAKKQQRVYMDHNALRMWDRVYEQLSSGQPGRFGAVTSRAEMFVPRLGLLYAMLDQSTHIGAEHLRAALALWWYCEDSARLIFGGMTKEQERIFEALHRKLMTATEIWRDVFKKHRRMPEIMKDLTTMMELGKIDLQKQNDGVERYEPLTKKSAV